MGFPRQEYWSGLPYLLWEAGNICSQRLHGRLCQVQFLLFPFWRRPLGLLPSLLSFVTGQDNWADKIWDQLQLLVLAHTLDSWTMLGVLSRSVVSNSCNRIDWSLLGSSVHGILQARMLERVAISFSRDLPDPGIKPRSPALTPLLTELEGNLVEQG